MGIVTIALGAQEVESVNRFFLDLKLFSCYARLVAELSRKCNWEHEIKCLQSYSMLKSLLHRYVAIFQ